MLSIPVLTRFLRATPRQRLWRAGVALAVFLLTIVIGNHFLSSEKSVTREMLGHDFLAFYTAGSLLRQDRVRELYNLESVKEFEQATAHAAGLEVGKSFGPWWNPPFYALVFQPLARLPYGKALDLWRWISVAAVAVAMGMLAMIVWQSSLSTRWQQWALVPLLTITSMPFIQSLSHGQNTFTSLLLLTAVVALWRSAKKLIAGCVCGLLFYKPQLGAVVAAAMVIDLGWESLAGLSVTGTFLLLTTLIAMPGSLGDWLHQLPINVRWMQVEHAYLWERHVTLKSFWRLLLQGREAGEATWLTTALTWTSVTAVGGALVWSGLKVRRIRMDKRVQRDRFITATITTMPLLMPFYFDYDLLLLVVPAVLYASERISSPDRTLPGDAWITARWVMLYLWLFVNPAFGLHTHVGGSVILLMTLAVGLIRRVNRADEGQFPILKIEPLYVARAA